VENQLKVTCSLSLPALFIPAFSLIVSSDNYYHELAICFLCDAIAFVILSCMFGHRVYVLYTKGDVPAANSSTYQRSGTLSNASEHDE